jgi:hypothetical protein
MKQEGRRRFREKFVKRHRRVLIDKFGIEKHGVPSYSTIRRILMGVDFENLAITFNQWAQNYRQAHSGFVYYTR